MNRVINGRTYAMSIVLYWGSDKSDIEKADKSTINSVSLNDTDIIQLDMITTLSTPFTYGSFVYSDSKSNSKLLNMIDMPIVHGRIMFIMTEGTDIPGSPNGLKPFGDENYIEDVVITGTESIDSDGSEKMLVRFNFASDDILKFTANLTGVSSFNKSESDKEREKVNEIIKKLFSSAKMSDKLDSESFTANTDKTIKYICASNENLLSALDYIYRKTYDDNFKKSKDCSYVRIIYNPAKHKYQQWKYDDVGTGKLLSGTTDMEEFGYRDTVTVDIGLVSEPKSTNGKFIFNYSGDSIDTLENFEKVKFTDFDYKKNKFESTEYDKLDKMIVSHSNEFNSSDVTRASIVNKNGDKFKDVDYMHEFTTSSQNGSIYDIITDSIFSGRFYRVVSDGSIGRKAGDEIYIRFKNSTMSPYETLKRNYLITAIDNRYELNGDDGKPSFKSIIDVHSPFVASDEYKRELPF